MKTINTTFKRITYAAGLCMAAMLLLMTGCKEDTAASIYDSNYTGGPQPVVANVASSNGQVVFAGISTLTITGSNFSPNPGDNLIYFDLVKGTVLAATATQLVVKAPIYVKDSVSMKIAVKGAAKYSEIKIISIAAAVSEYGKIAITDDPVGIATDKSGNLYASMRKSGVGDGIRIFWAAGDSSSQYAPSGGVTSWSGLKIGPGGVLFGARVQRALYTLPKGGAPVLWAQAAGSSLSDIDFDNLGNLWAVGNNANVYQFKVADKTVKMFPFTALLRCVRVYNGYVYVAGKQDSVEAVWRFKLATDGSLGASEEYFNLSKQSGYSFNGATVNAITFNTDGEMYLGTSSADAILLVRTDRSASVFYPGLFTPTTTAFAWGTGNTLYAVRAGDATIKTIVKINTLKTGAPYYGAQ